MSADPTSTDSMEANSTGAATTEIDDAQVEVLNAPDYTFYLSPETLSRLIQQDLSTEPESGTPDVQGLRSYSGPVWVRAYAASSGRINSVSARPAPEQLDANGVPVDFKQVGGRALGCLCYRGCSASATLRGKGDPRPEEAHPSFEEDRFRRRLSHFTADEFTSEVWQGLNEWLGSLTPSVSPERLEVLHNVLEQWGDGVSQTSDVLSAFEALWTNSRSRKPLLDHLNAILPVLSAELELEELQFEAEAVYDPKTRARLLEDWRLHRRLERQRHPPDPGTSASERPLVCGYRSKPETDDKHPVHFPAVYQLLSELVFELSSAAFEAREGLVVVAGSTSSGKSNIVRGMIYEYLLRYNRLRPKGRRPHLVTFEDPIEEWFVRPPDKGGIPSPAEARRLGVDYTPREKGKDAANLTQVLMDALRQTPAAVYVGETRDDRDWRELVKFAGTGHLVITTTHAGSLVETLERILKAVRADTPAERGFVAQRLLGVAHLQQIPSGQKEIVVPALWRQTPRNVAGLIADGLSSVLPRRPSVQVGEALPRPRLRPAPDLQLGVFGRRWFAERLDEMMRSGTHLEKWRAVPEDVAEKALALDLKGV